MRVVHISLKTYNLEYLEEETFTMPEYGGTIIFIRNDSNKIQGFKITIPMAGVEEMDANKEERIPIETH